MRVQHQRVERAEFIIMAGWGYSPRGAGPVTKREGRVEDESNVVDGSKLMVGSIGSPCLVMTLCTLP